MSWLTGWSYRKLITLSRASGAVANYQMLLNIAFDWWWNWVKHGSNPIISYGSQSWEQDAIYAPTVLLESGVFKMWANGHNVAAGHDYIGYLTSNDGISWDFYGGNPVLSPGGGGSWDAGDVGEPCVLKVGSTYYMYYAGSAAEVGGYNNEIGLATAPSPEGPWTKYGSNPVLAKAHNADEYWVGGPTVIYDTVAGLWKMWYTGVRSDYTIPGIFYATSADGITWIRHGLVVANCGSAGVVALPGGGYAMVVANYNTSTSAGLLYSVDGISWSYKNSTAWGLSGWDYIRVQSPSEPVLIDGHWWIWYGSPSNVGGTQFKIGLARSIDFEGNVSLEGKCQGDFDDVRLTKADGEMLLDYWIESVVANQYSKSQIEFDSIGTGATTFYVYYGKADAVAVSNILDTVIKGDDGVAGNFTESVAGSAVLSHTSGKYKITEDSVDDAFAAGCILSDWYFLAWIKEYPVMSGLDNAQTYFGLFDSATVANLLGASGTKGALRRVTIHRYNTGTSYSNQVILRYLDASDVWHYWTGSAWTTDVTRLDFGAVTLQFKIWSDGTNFLMDILGTNNVSKLTAPASIAISSVKAFSSGKCLAWAEPFTDTGYSTVSIDNYFVVQYRDPEPAWGSWGSEEEEFPPSGTSFVAWIN